MIYPPQRKSQDPIHSWAAFSAPGATGYPTVCRTGHYGVQPTLAIQLPAHPTVFNLHVALTGEPFNVRAIGLGQRAVETRNVFGLVRGRSLALVKIAAGTCSLPDHRRCITNTPGAAAGVSHRQEHQPLLIPFAFGPARRGIGNTPPSSIKSDWVRPVTRPESPIDCDNGAWADAGWCSPGYHFSAQRDQSCVTGCLLAVVVSS